MLSHKSLLKKGNIIQKPDETKYVLYVFIFDTVFGIINLNTTWKCLLVTK